MNNTATIATLLGIMLTAAPACCQDVSPLARYHVWLPMTGFVEKDLDDARAAGYDTVMLKIHPSVISKGEGVDFASTDRQIEQATCRGLNVILAILGWVGLGDGEFWDTSEDGSKIPNQLDPFWPEAMARVEWYYGQVIDRYRPNPRVVAFAPTWGIYGEAGFTSFEAGRSPHALARFNEWRAMRGLRPASALPTRKPGPNSEFNRFVRFRYEYVEVAFDAMVRRLQQRAGKLPVGMWQEMYPIVGYLWTMVEVPSADFALYESCFPFQTSHHPERTLAETMGFRYKCASAAEYRDYYLPLLARKRGEGQRFMGCQLTNDYAVTNYGWTSEKAEQTGFDRWEDEFGPVLRRLLNTPLESPKRDVLLVFQTYAAAALTDDPVHFADAAIIDTLLRSYGCQMARYGSPRLDKMAVEDMDVFRLIVIPDAAFLTRETWSKLKKTKAKVLLTGCFAQALDGELTAFGESREIDGGKIEYRKRPAGEVRTIVGLSSPFYTNLPFGTGIKLPPDETFHRVGEPSDVERVLMCGDEQLLTTQDNVLFIHGHLFAGACHNPDRRPAQQSGSKDASADEIDMWGPYDSAHPQNAFTLALMKNILDWAKVDYRVRNPRPRTFCKYLSDHMEQASISANLVYNNAAEPRTLTVRTPYPPEGRGSKRAEHRYETTLTVPAFSYAALKIPDSFTEDLPTH